MRDKTYVHPHTHMVRCAVWNRHSERESSMLEWNWKVCPIILRIENKNAFIPQILKAASHRNWFIWTRFDDIIYFHFIVHIIWNRKDEILSCVERVKNFACHVFLASLLVKHNFINYDIQEAMYVDQLGKTELCTKQEIIYIIVLQSLKFITPHFRGNPAKGDTVKRPLYIFQQTVISYRWLTNWPVSR